MMYSRSAAGSSNAPRRLYWFSHLASLPSAQSLIPATIRTISAQPSDSGPSSSHRNSGTPSSRSTERALGSVHTRSGSASRSSTGGEPAPASGIEAAADGPFDDVTTPPDNPRHPIPRLVEGHGPPPHSRARGEPLDGAALGRHRQVRGCGLVAERTAVEAAGAVGDRTEHAGIG